MHIVTVPSLIMAQFMSELPIWLILLICAPVAASILGFLFLLLFDRDKLQSEDYQLRKRSLEMIQQKGEATPLLVDVRAVEAIVDPEKAALESDTKENSK